MIYNKYGTLFPQVVDTISIIIIIFIIIIIIIIILAVVVAAAIVVEVFIFKLIETPMLLLPVVINFNSLYFMIKKELSL